MTTLEQPLIVRGAPAIYRCEAGILEKLESLLQPYGCRRARGGAGAPGRGGPAASARWRRPAASPARHGRHMPILCSASAGAK